MRPTNEHMLWASVRPYLPFYWRIEDKLVIGRPDVLYRLNLRGCDPTGLLELKMHPTPDPDKFWSGLTKQQGIRMREWGKFNNGKANLLMGVGGQWLLFDWQSPVVNGDTRLRYTLKEFYGMSRNSGDISEEGWKRLVFYLEEVHLGRST